jgi:hypothetical protein
MGAINMTHRVTENDIGYVDEYETELDASANKIWALAYGLSHEVNKATTADLNANKPLLIEAAHMILAAMELKQ